VAYDYGTIVTVTTSGGQSVDFLSSAGFIPVAVRLVASSTSDPVYLNFAATATSSQGYQLQAGTSEAFMIQRTRLDMKSRGAMQKLAFVCGSTQTASVRVYAQAF
jgi:hypothetical protein